MNIEDIGSLEQIKQFLDGTQAVAFAIPGNADATYKWIQAALIKYRYRAYRYYKRQIPV